MMKKELPLVPPSYRILVLLFVVWPLISAAQTNEEPAATRSVNAAIDASGESTGPIQLNGDFKAAIVIDADTGEILIAKDPHERLQPASMLKMMTELIVLERIAEGDVSLTDSTTVSARSSRMGGSQVYLKHGEIFSIEELLGALAIHSANDAAVCLAEHVAGSVEAFLDLMNLRALELGMSNTEFHTVHGLPPDRNQQADLTTPYDMAILAQTLVKYPEALKWSSTATAPFRNGKFIMYNPNKLIGKFRGLDGLKTGFHGRAGFCVTATAIQKAKRLISVVMGCPTNSGRATETTRLLSLGFNLYTRTKFVEHALQPLSGVYSVKGGKQKSTILAYGAELELCVPKTRVAEVVLQSDLPEQIPAPISEGDVVGRAVAMLDGHELGSVPIVATESIEKGNWFDRLFH